jgi:hypothetical protein
MRTSHDKSGAASGGLDRFALWRLAPKRGRDFTEVHAFGGLYGQPSRAIEGHGQTDQVYADRRRVHIAASIAAGRSIAAAARELGISREWASRIANAPETQQIIASLAQAHLERIYDLFDQALQVIQQAFRARRRGLQQGQVVDLGPDHYARLAAVGRLVQILTAGRPVPRAEEKKEEPREVTVEDIRAFIRAAEEAAERGKDVQPVANGEGGE